MPSNFSWSGRAARRHRVVEAHRGALLNKTLGFSEMAYIPKLVVASLALTIFWVTPILAETPLPAAITEICGLTKLKIEFLDDPAGFSQATVVIVADSNEGYGTRSILTFRVRSFGYECRRNLLNWGGFVVFQITCPPRHSARDPYDPCDSKNNFGVIFGSTVLVVPHAKNGRLAAEAFHYPYSKTIPALEPVRVIYRADDNGS
jgi:hypothetical protein